MVEVARFVKRETELWQWPEQPDLAVMTITAIAGQFDRKLVTLTVLAFTRPWPTSIAHFLFFTSKIKLEKKHSHLVDVISVRNNPT